MAGGVATTAAGVWLEQRSSVPVREASSASTHTHTHTLNLDLSLLKFQVFILKATADEFVLLL